MARRSNYSGAEACLSPERVTWGCYGECDATAGPVRPWRGVAALRRVAGCSGSPAMGTARGQGDTERQSGQGTAGRIGEVPRRLLASLIEL